MTLYQSRPQIVEAVQWTGTAASFDECQAASPAKVRLRGLNDLSLLAGKAGAQDWVPVPVGHWLVHVPGDLSDVWPVAPDYFAAKYEPVTTGDDRRKPHSGRFIEDDSNAFQHVRQQEDERCPACGAPRPRETALTCFKCGRLWNRHARRQETT